LLTERIKGELLVLHPDTNEAHALNETAAAVFELCNGSTSRAKIAEEVARRSGLPADEDIVALALTELEDAGLVVVDEPERRPIARRSVIRKLGLTVIAAAALPIVETMMVPPAEAQGPVPDQ
jgi:hypothetical protein